MKISIIIPTYNGAYKIINLIQSIELQNFTDLEVIIVVDGSTDETISVLKNYTSILRNIKIIEQTNGGRSVARNIGASNASGELLIFFDDDMRVGADCIVEHCRHHQVKANSIMVGSQLEQVEVLRSDIQKYKAYLSRKWARPLISKDKALDKENLFITAANFSIPKRIFVKLRGFDNRLTDAEDFDLAVRAYRENIPIYYNENAIGWHDDFITCKSYINRQKEYRKAHAYLKILKPNIYDKFNNHQVSRLNPLKKVFFYFFSFKFWEKSIDHFNWLIVLPKPIRYKIYSYVITSRSLYFQ